MTEQNNTDQPNSTDPATDKGKTEAAGKGVSDEKFSKEVAGETDPNLKAGEVFERESGGSATDEAASKSSADDIR